MKFIQAVLFLSLSILFSCSGGKKNVLPHKAEIDAYVDFLATQSVSSVDYILNLFDDFDMVILCERAHPEITQYDLIYEIIRDDRFIQKCGHVFTEIGSSSFQPAIHSLLNDDGIDFDEAQSRILKYARNMDKLGVWEKNNHYVFLQSVWQMNQSLPADQKVQVYPSDVAFSWEGMTAEKYQTFLNTLRSRDRLIAENIIHKFDEISRLPARNKALVILNGPLAFNDFQYPDGSTGGHTGSYLFGNYPGRVANVLLHNILFTSDSGKLTVQLIQNGKWDAAFKAVGNPDLGFNLADTPFGQDHCEYFEIKPHDQSYADIFTGYVFYRPLKEQKWHLGVPNLFDNGFDTIYTDRIRLTGVENPENYARNMMGFIGVLQEYTYDSIDRLGSIAKPDLAGQIGQWLK